MIPTGSLSIIVCIAVSRAVEIAYKRVRQGILSGAFAPGEHLRESDLVAYCGVSRTPVRSALNRLAADDLITLHRNQGARVKEWPADDVDDLFALRALLEGYAAARAAEHISLKQLDKIRTSIEEMDAVLISKKPLPAKIREFLRLNTVVHASIWEASGSARLQSMLSRLVEQALQVRTAATFTLDRIAESHHHHQELLSALAARDGLWAEAIMRSHIRAAQASLKRPID
jgi:DNA-binding GntR family transcriptional regulator